MFAFVYIDLPSHLGSREQVAREASTGTSIAISLCEQSCLSEAKFLCVEYQQQTRISRRQYYFTSAGRTSSESSCRAQKKRPIPQYNPQDQISDEHSPHVLYLQADIVLLREGIRVGEGSRSTHNTNLSIPGRRLYILSEVRALRDAFGEGANQP